MDLERKLKKAKNAIADAKCSLDKVKNIPESRSKIRAAISDLDDAETQIKRALREIN